MIKRFFKNIWVITVLGGALATGLYSWATGVNWGDGIKNIGLFIGEIITYPISLWIVILIFIGAWLVQKINKTKPLPKKLSFKEYRFKAWLWKWDWGWSQNQRDYVPVNLRPYCPHCATLMEYTVSIGTSTVKCPGCSYDNNDRGSLYGGHNFETMQGTRNLIQTKVEQEYSE